MMELTYIRTSLYHETDLFIEVDGGEFGEGYDEWRDNGLPTLTDYIKNKDFGFLTTVEDTEFVDKFTIKSNTLLDLETAFNDITVIVNMLGYKTSNE